MLGAIIGDIVGSRFEFNNTKDYNFEFFGPGCSFTDDTICTISVADALIHGASYSDHFANYLQHWCGKYPNPVGSYGGRFGSWVRTHGTTGPYFSFGNGSAMRVSPVGFMFGTDSDVVKFARLSAECTHNHPAGILGAQSVALAIYYLKQGYTIPFVYNNVAKVNYPGVSIRNFEPGRFDETCQYCVPLAFEILARSTDFEDAIRSAVAFGGDSDTLAAIVGGMAEAAFGIPDELKEKALAFLPGEMKTIVKRFYTMIEK